jgi:cyanate lyase
MNRSEATELILEAKRSRGLSFAEIADELGSDRVWTTAALLGQHPFDPTGAQALGRMLGLADEAIVVLQEVPTRGGLERVPPADPTLYRLYEALEVYGPALKALIHEDFGDGIMSAINFNVSLEKRETDEGERVRIILDGKFLPYTW